MDCIFCKIVSGDIPGTIVYEDESILAFHDISPIAPVHFLIIPKEHIVSAADLCECHNDIISRIFCAIPKILDKLGVTEGFRIVTNSGHHGGQTVSHLHFHVLAGRELAWPPG